MGKPVSERDTTANDLRDAAHDAFLAFWRATERDRMVFWAVYCAAQARYDAYLMRRQ
jgi:hypothetical protein